MDMNILPSKTNNFTFVQFQASVFRTQKGGCFSSYSVLVCKARSGSKSGHTNQFKKRLLRYLLAGEKFVDSQGKYQSVDIQINRYYIASIILVNVMKSMMKLFFRLLTMLFDRPFKLSALLEHQMCPCTQRMSLNLKRRNFSQDH